METHSNSFEVDNGIFCVFVVEKNCICKLWHLVAGVALAGYVKIPRFVLREPFKPVDKKSI